MSTESTESFVWTDDPDDPCAYDVQWMGPNGEDVDMTTIDTAIPWMPNGPVMRVFKGIHEQCALDVAEYSNNPTT